VRPVRLLLDENISPAVAVALCKGGIDTAHVRDRGMNGATDTEVLAKAYEEDRVLVTANVGDFEKLARAQELHAGIILVEDGALLRDEQELVVRRAASLLAAEQGAGFDLVNRVMRIGLDADATIEELP